MNGPVSSLEFGKVLERISLGVQSTGGREAVMRLRPGWEPAGSAGLRKQTDTASGLLAEGVRIKAAGNDDLLEVCSRLREGTLVLDASLLRAAGLALQDQRSFLDSVDSARDLPEDGLALNALMEPLRAVPELGRRLLSMTTPEGELAPSASVELARLLKQVDSLKRKLSGRIDSIYSSMSKRGVLRDMPPTLREGRYVLPVISSRKKDVRGIVHDRSESGETIFIEPAALVEDGNTLREAVLDLDQEVRRILRETTAELRAHLPLIRGSADAVAELDAVFARADFHREMETVFPGEGRLHLEDLRHPLIPAEEMVANTVSLPEDWKVLIVSGPNAGGKSVLLKSLGLAVFCAQSGIGCFAGAGSTMPFFNMVHVSIGDRQSIADHQSTYSARLKEQNRMLRSPGEGSLALIDEPAAGTDPLTGAALAASVLESLASTGGMAVVTTHQGQLKSLAQGRRGFYNGSMNFRKDTLEPDYTYIQDIPGSSFTLEIARRMGFPAGVLERAEELSGDSFRLDRMLEEVTAARRELRSRLEDLAEREEESSRQLEAGTRQLERDSDELRQRREDLAREFEGLKRELNSRADSLLSRLARSRSPEERRELRERIREITRTASVEAPDREIDSHPPDGDIEAGDWVTVEGWSGTGVVEEVGRDHIAVTIGNLRLRKPIEEVRKAPPPDEGTASAGWSAPVEADTELDFRGMSADQALMELDSAIDDGLAAGIPFIRVIHGKGRGILMKAVVDMAKRDGRISTFRPGKPSEGGTGVTIVYLGTGDEKGR